MFDKFYTYGKKSARWDNRAIDLFIKSMSLKRNTFWHKMYRLESEICERKALKNSLMACWELNKAIKQMDCPKPINEVDSIKIEIVV